MISDNKVKADTIDRRNYYAPSSNGLLCPFVKLDDTGKQPLVSEDKRETYTVRKTPKCICLKINQVCSYNSFDDYHQETVYQLDVDGNKIHETDANGVYIYEEDGSAIYKIASQTEKEYFCHRYVPWREDKERPPVDTHGLQLKAKGRKLDWY